MSGVLLELSQIKQTFYQGEISIEVLKGVNLKVQRGEIMGLIGPSGSGKTSLLHIAGLLEKASEGDVLILGNTVNHLDDNARTKIRLKNLGFVYQFHHLLGEFSASENVALPQIIAGKSKKSAKKRAEELMEMMGLGDRLGHRPARLSGGEQQRVAVARALSNEPDILLADEPTGNLDQETGERVFSIIQDVVKKMGIGAVIATHNMDLAMQMDRVAHLQNGSLIFE